MKKIIRITTVGQSMLSLLRGQLKFMSQHYEIFAVFSGKEFKERIEDAQGVKAIEVEMTRKITPVKDFIALIRLFRICKHEKPFIVHTHTPKAGLLGMMAARFAGVPHRLHTVAGMPLMEATGFKRNILDWVEKITYSCATLILPNSFGLYNFILENQYTSNKKIKVLGNGSSNGIDTEFFSPDFQNFESVKALRMELKIPLQNFVFVFVGRMVGDKGINELISAFDLLSETHKHINLLLVGSREDHLDPLDQKTEDQLKTNKKIVFAGGQSDVRPFLAISNVFVFPSYREGFPNAVMEAGAMGLPSIVTDINGCNEIVAHEFNGLIVSPKSSEKLYEAMIRLLTDEGLLHKLAFNARPMIVERYERTQMWDLILKEYQGLECKEV